MAWLRIDDNVPHHRKMLAAGSAASWLWLCAVAYCQRHGTDGFIPTVALPLLGPADWKKALPAAIAAKLIDVAVDGYTVHDYLHHNDSAEERRFKSESNRRRVDLFRDGDLRTTVRQRDGDACRYCGVRVIWTDRRGPHGGTYDHVDPRVGNVPENLVVCCRSCNSSKQRRTPQQAGMVLRPAPNHESNNQIQVVSKSDLLPPHLTSPHLTTPGGVPLSPLVSAMKPYNAWQGLRLEVPQKWHTDAIRKLGGSDAEDRLLRWYPTIDTQLQRSQTAVQNWFRWLDACFAEWISGGTRAAEQRTQAHLAKVAGMESGQ